jgi:hypothetical protein
MWITSSRRHDFHAAFSLAEILQAFVSAAFGFSGGIEMVEENPTDPMNHAP